MMTINREGRKSLGIYVHIPFCVRKCRYCDFLSFSCRSEEEISSYVDACIREIHAFRGHGAEYIIDTIFFGGGTPSVMEPHHLERILKEIRHVFTVSADAEITMEANPGTLTDDKLKIYLAAGINRLSLGVQSFDDKILQGLGRIHSAAEAAASFRMAREAGFQNISMDLMFAVPGLTMEIWERTLSMAAELGPEHISFYSLQIEEGTEFGRLFEEGVLTQTDIGLDRDMYHFAIEYLAEHGYQQYEISNAARAGFWSRHNMRYWSMEEYLGIGAGASSYIRPYQSMEGISLEGAGMSFRSANTSSLDEYLSQAGGMKSVLDGALEVSACSAEVHENTFFDDASEFVFTGLRRTQGICFGDFYEFTGKHFFEVFGDEIKERIAAWEKDGYLILERVSDCYGDERDYSMHLTVSGFDISNSIMMEFV